MSRLVVVCISSSLLSLLYDRLHGFRFSVDVDSLLVLDTFSSFLSFQDCYLLCFHKEIEGQIRLENGQNSNVYGGYLLSFSCKRWRIKGAAAFAP